MKTTRIKFLLLGFFISLTFTGCSPENDIEIPNSTDYKLYEQFFSNTTDGDEINLSGWTNFAQVGTVKWKQGIYYSDKYAEFTSYQSGQPSNIGWLVSPPISVNKENVETLAFDVAQAYVSSSANSIEVLVSTDFDGTNVMAANWVNKTFTTPSLAYEDRFKFFSSGLINLADADYEGNIYIAFKCKGSGTNFSLDGTYEVDNIRIFNKK